MQNLSFNLAFLTVVNPFTKVVEPLVTLINFAFAPAMSIVGALGAIYCILLGVKLAKAEEQQDRDKAKKSLQNALIGFVSIFVLLVVLRLGLPALEIWMNAVTPKQ